MNIDQIKGELKEAAGKAQTKAGDLMDSPEQKAKGLAKEAEGKMQKALGDTKEALKDSVDKV